MSKTLDLTKELISKPSVTPNDMGCQDLISQRLKTLGFEVEQINFGEVSNLWATIGEGNKMLVLLGHTDVVPTGPIEQWDSDPFTATQREGLLYGRGVADMKGSVAAFITACEEIYTQKIPIKEKLGIMLTSDEEGPARYGTKKVIEKFKKENMSIEFCIVGEPTSSKVFGDTIKNGRRGSLSGKLKIFGIQGHIA